MSSIRNAGRPMPEEDPAARNAHVGDGRDWRDAARLRRIRKPCRCRRKEHGTRTQGPAGPGAGRGARRVGRAPKSPKVRDRPQRQRRHQPQEDATMSMITRGLPRPGRRASGDVDAVRAQELLQERPARASKGTRTVGHGATGSTRRRAPTAGQRPSAPRGTTSDDRMRD